MGQPRLALGVVAPPKSDKEFVEYGTALLLLAAAHRRECPELYHHIGVNDLHTRSAPRVGLRGVCLIVLAGLSAIEEHEIAVGVIGFATRNIGCASADFKRA